MSIPVYIAIYAIVEGNFHHWAVYIKQSQEEQHVYEVVSEHPTFQYNHIVINNHLSDATKDSQRSNPAATTVASTTSKAHDGQHIKDILVGYVTTKDVTQISETLPLIPIDNDNPGWCCQDWVLEALEGLCEDYILDEDDELYNRGIRKAKRDYFGPNL